MKIICWFFGHNYWQVSDIGGKRLRCKRCGKLYHV